MGPALVALITALVVVAQDAKPSLDGMATPTYTADGDLILPEAYRTWIFVGASLGLSYSEGAAEREGPGTFTNVYIQPEAYRYFMQTGEFPEGTMLPMDIYRPGSRESINQAGYFEKDFLGMESRRQGQRAVRRRLGLPQLPRPVRWPERIGVSVPEGPVLRLPRGACSDGQRVHAVLSGVAAGGSRRAPPGSGRALGQRPTSLLRIPARSLRVRALLSANPSPTAARVPSSPPVTHDKSNLRSSYQPPRPGASIENPRPTLGTEGTRCRY